MSILSFFKNRKRIESSETVDIDYIKLAQMVCDELERRKHSQNEKKDKRNERLSYASFALIVVDISLVVYYVLKHWQDLCALDSFFLGQGLSILVITGCIGIISFKSTKEIDFQNLQSVASILLAVQAMYISLFTVISNHCNCPK